MMRQHDRRFFGGVAGVISVVSMPAVYHIGGRGEREEPQGGYAALSPSTSLQKNVIPA